MLGVASGRLAMGLSLWAAQGRREQMTRLGYTHVYSTMSSPRRAPLTAPRPRLLTERAQLLHATACGTDIAWATFHAMHRVFDEGDDEDDDEASQAETATCPRGHNGAHVLEQEMKARPDGKLFPPAGHLQWKHIHVTT